MSDVRPIHLPIPLPFGEKQEQKDTKFDRFGQRIIARFVATRANWA